MPIHLPEGQKLDSKVLRHISGASPVYIRALKELDENEEVSLLVFDTQLRPVYTYMYYQISMIKVCSDGTVGQTLLSQTLITETLIV